MRFCRRSWPLIRHLSVLQATATRTRTTAGQEVLPLHREPTDWPFTCFTYILGLGTRTRLPWKGCEGACCTSATLLSFNDESLIYLPAVYKAILHAAFSHDCEAGGPGMQGEGGQVHRRSRRGQLLFLQQRVASVVQSPGVAIAKAEGAGVGAHPNRMFWVMSDSDEMPQ